MSSCIEIYTKDLCPYCQRAKELLRIKGATFIEYDVSADQVKAEEMLQRSKSRAVPEIFIDNRLIGGCAELFELDEKGELNGLLGLS